MKLIHLYYFDGRKEGSVCLNFLEGVNKNCVSKDY